MPPKKTAETLRACQKLFVAGTDTHVGKTLVTGLLARVFADAGCRVVTQKWVETGTRQMFSDDVARHLVIMNRSQDDYREHLTDMSPYILKKPASPHLASRLEKKTVSASKIRASADRLSKAFDYCIIEGSGGVCVPVNQNLLLIHLIEKMRMPVVIVARNTLGAINHTLLTVEACKRRHIQVAGIVFNEQASGSDPEVLSDNPAIIRKFSGVDETLSLPYTNNEEELVDLMRPFGKKIRAALKRGGFRG